MTQTQQSDTDRQRAAGHVLKVAGWLAASAGVVVIVLGAMISFSGRSDAWGGAYLVFLALLGLGVIALPLWLVGRQLERTGSPEVTTGGPGTTRHRASSGHVGLYRWFGIIMAALAMLWAAEGVRSIVAEGAVMAALPVFLFAIALLAVGAWVIWTLFPRHTHNHTGQ